jgi:dTMP kinase
VASKKEIPGKLIAVEGLDGSGKSTQIYLLKRWLELRGHKVFFTEWNSSEIVRRATRKGKKRQLLTPTTFSLIHSTDFADRYDRHILPLLEAGAIVLADRYVFTAFARDAVRGCNPEWLRALYSYAVEPDITFYFKVPLDVALGRILEGRPRLKYHEAGMDMGLSTDPYESFRIFQGRIQTEYEKLTREFGFTVIDATASPEQQQSHLRRIVEGQIKLAHYRWRVPAPYAAALGAPDLAHEYEELPQDRKPEEEVEDIDA